MSKNPKRECHICGKQVVLLARHVRQTHHIYPMNNLVPTNLKQFVEMIALFPINSEEWHTLCQWKDEVKSYIENKGTLPTELFTIVYQAFESYKSMKDDCPKIAYWKPVHSQDHTQPYFASVKSSFNGIRWKLQSKTLLSQKHNIENKIKIKKQKTLMKRNKDKIHTASRSLCIPKSSEKSVQNV